MSQVITTRNNKQSGGTYVSIKPTDGSSDKFKTSEEDDKNLKTLLENCEFIGCINASSANSTIFVCYLSEDGNIVLRSEREPDKNTYQFCIKVSFIRTAETSSELHSLKLQFKHSKEPHEVDKNIKTADEVITEGGEQKLMFDSLQPNVLKDIIPDTIAMGIVKPDEFETFTAKIFDRGFEGVLWRNPAELEIQHEKIIFTVTVVQSIIENAKQHNLDLGVTFMDYFENAISFEQYVEKHCSHPESLDIGSVKVFHNTGYYKDVYKIVEIVGAYIISILEITGLWNYDLNSGNIMVNGGGGEGEGGYSDIKLIDFGYTKNLKDQAVKQEIVDIFVHVYKRYSPQQFNIRRFVNVPLLRSNTGKEEQDAIKFFSKEYDEAIMKLPTNIQILLKPESTDGPTNAIEKKTKRKIIFKILMFLTFIDGLIQIQKFDKLIFQCSTIMSYMFNCNIFDDFATFVEFSSLDYFKFLDIEHGFNKRLPIISTLTTERYTGLCNTILDNICSRIAELLSESGKKRYTSSVGSSEGGKGISKKIYPRLRKSTKRTTRTRRPSRKSGTKRLSRRRPRRSRTSRK